MACSSGVRGPGRDGQRGDAAYESATGLQATVPQSAPKQRVRVRHQPRDDHQQDRGDQHQRDDQLDLRRGPRRSLLDPPARVATQRRCLLVQLLGEGRAEATRALERREPARPRPAPGTRSRRRAIASRCGVPHSISVTATASSAASGSPGVAALEISPRTRCGLRPAAVPTARRSSASGSAARSRAAAPARRALEERLGCHKAGRGEREHHDDARAGLAPPARRATQHRAEGRPAELAREHRADRDPFRQPRALEPLRDPKPQRRLGERPQAPAAQRRPRSTATLCRPPPPCSPPAPTRLPQQGAPRPRSVRRRRRAR